MNKVSIVGYVRKSWRDRFGWTKQFAHVEIPLVVKDYDNEQYTKVRITIEEIQ